MSVITRSFCILCVCLLSTFMMQCSEKAVRSDPPSTNEPSRTPDNLTAAERELANGINRFGLKLFREIIAQEKTDINLFVSPLSVSMALGMTYNGANGATRDEMQQTLELTGLSLEEVNKSYQSLTKLLCRLDPNVSLTIANSIWARQGLPVKDQFVDLNRTYFDALIRNLDFNLAESADTINNWVKDQTAGKIDEVVTRPIDPALVMFLINAVYFNADWAIQFDPDSTTDGPFHLVDSSTVTCSMMTRADTFSVLHAPTFFALDLPYGDSSFSMMIFLPNDGIDVNELISEFTDEKWSVWTDKLQPEPMPLILPKFKIEYEIELKDVLRALGMNLAFSTYADFINMVEGGGVAIDHVKHKTYVDVDERGTEAAAVTVVGIFITSFPPSHFLVNRPFLFVIYERVSKTIVFMGRVADPTAG